MSKATGTRPSDLIAVENDPLAAFCFDRAVFSFGSALQGEINAVEGRNESERKNRLDTLLRRWLPDSTASKKFADPRSAMNRRKR